MKKEKTYKDWLMVAATAGIDWENNPPPQEFLTEETIVAAVLIHFDG